MGLYEPKRTQVDLADFIARWNGFNCDCQCCSFPIQRNRDEISKREFDVGVFTQAGSKPEKLKTKRGVFLLKKLNFLRANEAHRSAAIVPQRFDHPPAPRA